MKTDEKTYTTYILRCSDGTYYTGYARSLKDRLRKHQLGLGAKYTRTRRPVELVASWTFPSRSQAMKLEAAIKRQNRRKKESFIKGKPSPEEMEEDLLKGN